MTRGDRVRRWGCEGESDGKRNTAEDSGVGMGGTTAWLGAANPEWESASENGVRGCVAWKVGGAGGGWLAGWGWGGGR